MGLRDQYGTQAMIGGTTPTAAPAPVAPLAQSMQNAGASVMSPGSDYQIGQPMTNLMVPSTLGTNPVAQPMMYPFDRPTTLPPSDQTTQTGNGGGQSTLPGASIGQFGQANTGSALAGSGTGQRYATAPPGFTQPPLEQNPWANQVYSGPIVPKGNNPDLNKTAGGPTSVGPPTIPLAGQDGPIGGQAFANQQAQGILNSPALMHLLQSGRGGGFAKALHLDQTPLSFTADQFNRVKQGNPAAAFQMAQAGGQQFRNAIMQNNGMTQEQMNQWLNNTGYNTPGAFAGMTPENLSYINSFQ